MKKIFPIIAIFILGLTNVLQGQNATLEIPKGCKESEFLTSDSVRLHYLISGKGDPLIFIPGWTMPAEIWENQIKYFSKTNLVISLNLRSQGTSSQTAEGLYFEREAKDIKELVDHLHLSTYSLIGWSMGGPVLFNYLNLHSSPSIKKVIIVESLLKMTDAISKDLISLNKGLLLNRLETTSQFIRGMYKQPQSEAYLKKLIQSSMITPTNSAVLLLSNYLFNDDAEWVKTIKNSKIPILFIGASDSETLYKETNLEVKINYEIIPESGHAVFVDKPLEFNKILENFISKK